MRRRRPARLAMKERCGKPFRSRTICWRSSAKNALTWLAPTQGLPTEFRADANVQAILQCRLVTVGRRSERRQSWTYAGKLPR